MKINQWARIQTMIILKDLSLWILAIIFPVFLIGLIFNQISNVDATFHANKKNIIISMQTGDIITLEKTLNIYTHDPSLLGYDLYDRDHQLVKKAFSSSAHFLIFSKNFDLNGSDKSNWGSMTLYWTPNWSLFFYFMLAVIAIVSMVAFVILKSWNKFSNTLIEVIEQMPTSLKAKPTSNLLNEVDEIKFVFQKLQKSKNQEKEHQKLLADRDKQMALVELSQKVAHDIRSPLSALSLATSTANLDDARKNLVENSIHRMSEICENLLSERRKSISHKNVTLGFAIDQIILEKQACPSGNLIQFEVSSTTNAINIPDAELKNVLSNLIQNSIESMDKTKRKISVLSFIENDKVAIQIKDNGKGIPSQIIQKLGLESISFDKASGNGLGFFNAKQWALRNGGDIKIQSTVGHGTEIKVSFSSIM